MTVQWYYYYTINFAKGVGLNRKQKKLNLDKYNLYTAREASLILGKGRNYVTNIINYYPNRLPKGSFKKVGDKTYIITEEGIEALRSQTENKNKKKE